MAAHARRDGHPHARSGEDDAPATSFTTSAPAKGRIPIAAAKEFGATRRRHRIRPGASPRSPGATRARGRRATRSRSSPGDVFKEDFSAGERRHAVPAARPQPAAAPADRCALKPGHARRLATCGTWGNGSPTRRLRAGDERGVPVDRPGAGGEGGWRARTTSRGLVEGELATCRSSSSASAAR